MAIHIMRFCAADRGAGRGDRAALRFVDWLARYPFALITARIPNWYAVQHVTVHHAENNGLDDNQSTARYDRASFSGFAACLQRFAASGLLPVDVALYLRAKRRRKALRRLAVGYAAYLSFLLVLGIHDPAIVVVFVLIRYVGLLADGASFFQEHGLLDPEHPDEVVTNSLHYINRDNKHGSRGEDLHIEHHRSPGVHWTRYPERADFHRDEYERLHAIGFHDGPDQLETYYRCLWRQDFAELSTHVHVFGGERLGTGELVRLLRHRTAPAGRDRLPISALEAGVGKLAAHLI
ncbi:MAG: fatty acid desaturase [Rhodospirillales bacterium]|nr:fatty acid desaturase [Rhodospirillales bacterium]